MRLAKRLFIHYESFEKSNFTLLYNNNTALWGSISPISGTDGVGLEDISIVEGSLVEGRWHEADKELHIMLDNAQNFLLYKTPYEWLLNKTTPVHLFVDFIATNFEHLIGDRVKIPAVQHPYDELAHQSSEFENNFLINWYLGNTCSYSCSYCPPWLNDGSQPWGDFNVIKAFCDKMIEQVPKHKKIIIEFTGGEVTMWKDYAKLCHYLRSRGITISMITNGSRTLRWWEENYTAFSVVNMSYHTEFANREQFMELSKFLITHLDLRVFVMTPAEKVDECVEIGKELSNMGISVSLKPLTENLVGELFETYTEEILQKMNVFNSVAAEQLKGVNTKSDSVSIRADMVKRTIGGTSSHVHLVELISNRENTWYGWECYAGVEQIVIDSDGYAYRGWCKVGGKIGHIADPGFKLVTKTIQCNKELCNCPFDMFATRKKYIPTLHNSN